MLAPGVPIDRRRRWGDRADPAARRGLGGRPHRRPRRRPRRPLPAPRLPAERRLRRRRHRPLRLPRVPVRAATGTASRSPPSAPAATIPPKADVARRCRGRRALRPGVARAGAAAGADHRGARVGRPGVRRRPAPRPGVARRGGADGRQLPRPRPLPVHPPRHVRGSRRHRGPAVLGRARRAGVHLRLRPLDQAIGRFDGRRGVRGGAAALDVVVRRPVRHPAAHRLPGRRRRAHDPVLPPARRCHHDEAVLLRHPQRHRRRAHCGRGHGRLPAGRRRGGPRAPRADRVEGRATRRPGRGAHPRRPDHARDAPGPPRPRPGRGSRVGAAP